MADRMSTANRMDRLRDNAAVTRTVNGHKKRKAAAVRDARMKDLITRGAFPYTPAVMSWVAEKLGKRTAMLTEAEVRALAK